MLTGSDDGNVRIWKARADEKLGVITARERAAIEYRDALKQRWKYDAEVGKVSRFVVFSPSLVPSADISALQEPAHAKTSLQGGTAQADNARRAAGQGGAEAEAHEGWREQAEGGKKEVGSCGANLTQCVVTILI